MRRAADDAFKTDVMGGMHAVETPRASSSPASAGACVRARQRHQCAMRCGGRPADSCRYVTKRV